jgi:hypothetical protein
MIQLSVSSRLQPEVITVASGVFLNYNFKFHLIVGIELWIVNALYRLRITDLTFYTSDAFTIDSSTPTTR